MKIFRRSNLKEFALPNQRDSISDCKSIFLIVCHEKRGHTNTMKH